MSKSVQETTIVSVAAQVRRAEAGDGDAVEFLARRACRLALRTTVTVLGSRQGAEDVSQDVAVDVLGSLGKLRDPEAFDAWVHRITVRHARRALRRRAAARRAEVPFALLPADGEPLDDEPDHAGRLAARAALAGAVAELPQRQRIALALRYVHDLSDAEIAAALSCRPGTVHALLSRARSALRDSPELTQLAPTPLGG